MLTFSPITTRLLRHHEHRILITGASGWLGRALLEMLATAFGALLAERVILCSSKPRQMVVRAGLELPMVSLADGLALLGDKPALLFHFAFLTKEKVGDMSEQTYIDRNRAIMDDVAQAVADRRFAGVMFASSGAVYDFQSGARRDGAANLYGMLKAEGEQRYAVACDGASARLIAPRIFNISGPYINKFRAYVLASIILDTLQGGPIELKANMRVYRSYVYVADVLDVVFRYLLDDGYDLFSPFIDIAGVEVIEVGELAHSVIEVLGRRSVQIRRPLVNEALEDRYVGNPSMLQSLCRRYGIELLPLAAQISSTASYIALSLGPHDKAR